MTVCDHQFRNIVFVDSCDCNECHINLMKTVHLLFIRGYYVVQYIQPDNKQLR